LGIDQIRWGARNFQIKEKKSELFEYHLHGNVKSILTLVLEKEGKDYAAISFRKLRKSNDIEIARYVVRPGFQIIGGFKKLLKESISLIKLKFPECVNLISYVDRDFTPCHEDSVYEKNGFEYLGQSGPILRYTNFKEVVDRRNFQKHLLPSIFVGCDTQLKTADEILEENGWHPFYNSGNFKYQLRINV
jgi:hypothetical protein